MVEAVSSVYVSLDGFNDAVIPLRPQPYSVRSFHCRFRLNVINTYA